MSEQNTVLHWALKFNNPLGTEEAWHLKSHTLKVKVDLQQGVRAQIPTDSRCTDCYEAHGNKHSYFIKDQTSLPMEQLSVCRQSPTVHIMLCYAWHKHNTQTEVTGTKYDTINRNAHHKTCKNMSYTVKMIEFHQEETHFVKH